ncbi:MAG TPA: zinc ribbon domain-containing protein [Pyrinomonadaceae bacterium]|nr:zinc ribbon domain-containing protein [Pyrinomonadaceae bacterium]
MFCPQCGLESQAELKFCRSCGANLKVIGKAVTLSEAIARSDGVPAKIKEMVQNLKVDKVTEEVARAMDKMKSEIARTSVDHRDWKLRLEREEYRRSQRRKRKEKTPAERRERLLTRGWIKFGWGSGLALFLYFLSHSLVLKLDPNAINKIPFDVESVVRVIWLIGVIPVLSGLGHIFAGLMVKNEPARELELPEDRPLRIDVPPPDPEMTVASARQTPASVTERTTNILDRDQPLRRSGIN